MNWKKTKEGYPKHSGLYLVHEDGAIRMRYWVQEEKKFELVEPDENGFDVAPGSICFNPTDWYDVNDIVEAITAKHTAP